MSGEVMTVKELAQYLIELINLGYGDNEVSIELDMIEEGRRTRLRPKEYRRV